MLHVLPLSFAKDCFDHRLWARLKCDRGQPCETCVTRGLSLSCTYVNSSSVQSNSVKSQPRPPAYQKLQDRISQLEGLISSQMKGVTGEVISSHESANSKPIPDFGRQFSTNEDWSEREKLPQEASQVSKRFGRISVENEGTTWVEGDHWTAIIDGVSELKDSLIDVQDYGTPDLWPSSLPDSDGPELLLGENRHVSKQDILAAVPGRPIVDSLVSHFFESVEIAPIVLHIPTFLNEYEQFWETPEQTSILWVGLLLGIICLAKLQQQFGFDLSEKTKDTQDAAGPCLAQSCRVKMSQCLILGNYTKPAPYAIETLLFYMQIEHLQSKDAQTGSWILLGIVIRLALRMGYHQDASHFPRISPFQAEMRRRIWCIILMIDAGASAQFGLPRMIRVLQSNTAEPTNLLDEDIRKDMCEIPSARPESIVTPVQYFVAKNRILSVLGKISDLNLSTQSPQYMEIFSLDGSLHSAYDNIPQPLVMRAMTNSIMDSPSLILKRIYVALLFNKAKCVLHRRYLIRGKTDKRYVYSRTACLESALAILQIQDTMNQEMQPGRRLYGDRGKVSSVVRGDFLLATTILCVDANHSITNKRSSPLSSVTPDLGLSETVINALQGAYSIWARATDSSREAQQATQALKLVLDKALVTKTSLGSAETTAPSSNAHADSDLRENMVALSQASEQTHLTEATLPTPASTLFADLLTSDNDCSPSIAGFDFNFDMVSKDLYMKTPKSGLLEIGRSMGIRNRRRC